MTHSQLPVLFLLTTQSFSIFNCKEYNQFDFDIYYPWSPCAESSLSCVFRRGSLLWSVCSPGKTLLAFALLHFVLQGQTCLLLQVSLDFLLLHSSSLWWKGHIFLMLVLEGLEGHHGTIQLQFLRHYWLGHRFRWLCYWIVYLGKKQRSFCHFWNCTSTAFQTLWLTMKATPVILRDPCPQ